MSEEIRPNILLYARFSGEPLYYEVEMPVAKPLSLVIICKRAAEGSSWITSAWVFFQPFKKRLERND